MIVEKGSFSAAARAMRRSQTAVSYAILSLERQLGVQLFDRVGHRPTLTSAGASLVADAHKVTFSLNNLRAHAEAIASGVEPELAIAIDAYFPPSAMMDPLREFASTFPQVAVQLHHEPIGIAREMVADGRCTLGIISHAMSLRPDFQQVPIPEVIRMVPVVARGHPLARATVDLQASELADHVQIVSMLHLEVAHGTLSPRHWACSDLVAQRAVVRAGIGWSALPLYIVEEDLAAGDLCEIRIAAWVDRSRTDIPMSIVRLSDARLGPAAAWLLDRMSRPYPASVA